MPTEALWTARQTAEFLGLTERTLRRISVPRVAIYAHPGARPIVRYDPAEVRAWVEARKSRTLLTTGAKGAA